MLNKHKVFEVFCFFIVNDKYLFVSLFYVNVFLMLFGHFCLSLFTISRNYDAFSYAFMIAV